MKKKKKPIKFKLSWRKVSIGVIAALVLAAIAFGFFTYVEARRAREAKKFRRAAEKIWQGVVDKSSNLEASINEAQAKEDLEPLSKELSETEDYITKELYKAASLTATAKYLSSKRDLIKALDDYADYLARAQQVTLRLSKGKGKADDFSELKIKAEKARKSCQKFVKRTDFAKKGVPERVFSVALRLQLIVEKSKSGEGLSLIEEAEERGKAIVEARREKEAKEVEAMAAKWLDGEIAGGTDINWELASTRFKEQTLSTFPEEERNQQTYLQRFQEGEAHFQLVSYEIVEAFILSYEEALVSIVAVRQNIDGTETPSKQEELPLVAEDGKWLVDGVGF